MQRHPGESRSRGPAGAGRAAVTGRRASGPGGGRQWPRGGPSCQVAPEGTESRMSVRAERPRWVGDRRRPPAHAGLSALWTPPCVEPAACCPWSPASELRGSEPLVAKPGTRGACLVLALVWAEGGAADTCRSRRLSLVSRTSSYIAPAGVLLSPQPCLGGMRGGRGAVAELRWSGQTGRGRALPMSREKLWAWNPEGEGPREPGSASGAGWALALPPAPRPAGHSPAPASRSLPPLPLPGPLPQAGVQLQEDSCPFPP